MRNALLALVGLVLTASALPAQTSWADKMFKDGLTHDFGNVARGANLHHPFKITNIYDARLEIVQTRVSCGCVTVTPSVRFLEPRQTATIDVFMDARRFSGPKTVSIYLTVGPEYVSTATLTVSAHSRADVSFLPGQVTFGVLAAGQTPTQSVLVEYVGGLNWHITDIVYDKEKAPYTVAFRESYRQPGQAGYRVEVTLKPNVPAGALRQELLLKTDDPNNALVPLLVEATVQGNLSVSPGAISFGTLRVGDSVSRKVIVKGTGQPFRIVAVEGQGDGVLAELPPAAAAVQVVTLTCKPDRAGELQRQLQIKTDLPGQALVTVAVEGRAQKE